MSINWKDEIKKAESWSDKKECCAKYIDLAKQIANEAQAYKSMWEAEFDMRRNLKSSAEKLEHLLEEYRRKIIYMNDDIAENQCAARAMLEVLKMAVPQVGKRTQILKTIGGEENIALLIPLEEVNSVIERYGYLHTGIEERGK